MGNAYKLSFAIVRLMFFSFLILSFSNCRQKHEIVSIDPGFSKYIEAYTTGVISKKSTIRIQLAAEANTTHALNETVDKSLFSISPSVDGKPTGLMPAPSNLNLHLILNQASYIPFRLSWIR